MESFDVLHSKAIEIVGRYKKIEFELLEVLEQIDSTKAYLKLGNTSLFDYTVKALGLTESVAYNFITVSRKASIVPELKKAIQTGDLTVSKARKITPVITLESQTEWISKASELTSKALEKEVARAAPLAISSERAKYIREDRLTLSLGLKEEYFKKLRRVQDLESQIKSKAVTVEEALMEMIDLFLEKRDPVEKAKRILDKKPVSRQVQKTKLEENAPRIKGNAEHGSLDKKAWVSQKTDEYGGNQINKDFQNFLRRPIPAQIRHKVHLRDKGKCTHSNCDQQRWLDLHHVIPVKQGGQNTLENLRTLCAAHHKIEHLEGELERIKCKESCLDGHSLAIKKAH